MAPRKNEDSVGGSGISIPSIGTGFGATTFQTNLVQFPVLNFRNCLSACLGISIPSFGIGFGAKRFEPIWVRFQFRNLELGLLNTGLGKTSVV